VTEGTKPCPICGAAVPDGAASCPRCSTPLSVDGTVAAPAGDEGDPSLAALGGTGSPSGGRRRGAKGSASKGNGPSPALLAQMDRLESWQQKAASLRIVVPTLPKWVQGSAMSAADEERWEQGVQGLVRAAYKQISGALDTWQRDAGSRLNRLEAYGMPSPTERRSLEELGRTLKSADLDQSLDLYEKISTVVAMKERTLNDALDAVEALKLLATDLEAVKLEAPWKDATVPAKLESEVRSGKVSEALQEASRLRGEAAKLLNSVLPSRVNEEAERIASEKGKGSDVKGEAALLARAARALRQGRAEDALRDLVRYQGKRTLDPFAMVEQELKGGI
jgi:hypothetical protein